MDCLSVNHQWAPNYHESLNGFLGYHLIETYRRSLMNIEPVSSFLPCQYFSDIFLEPLPQIRKELKMTPMTQLTQRKNASWDDEVKWRSAWEDFRNCEKNENETRKKKKSFSTIIFFISFHFSSQEIISLMKLCFVLRKRENVKKVLFELQQQQCSIESTWISDISIGAN